MKKVACALVGLSLSSSAFAASPMFAVSCTETIEHGSKKGTKTILMLDRLPLGSIEFKDSENETLHLTTYAPGCDSNMMEAEQISTFDTVTKPLPMPQFQEPSQFQGQGKMAAQPCKEQTVQEMVEKITYGFRIVNTVAAPQCEMPQPVQFPTQAPTQFAQVQEQGPCKDGGQDKGACLPPVQDNGTCQDKGPAQQQDQCQGGIQQAKGGCGPIQEQMPPLPTYTMPMGCDDSLVTVTLERKHHDAHLHHSKVRTLSRGADTQAKVRYHASGATFATRTTCTVTHLGM